MSLTTVAGPVQPDRNRRASAESRPERFQRSDFIAAALVFGITLLVYVVTLSPSVTLEDSGELITGAAVSACRIRPAIRSGRCRAISSRISFPFGNVAWRVNLQSAVFGAAANAVLTLLVCHSGRWLAQRWAPADCSRWRAAGCSTSACSPGCVIGFSDVMWSQGVIAEVYTLNGLFVNLVLLFFYFWMLEPRKTHRLVIAVFVFALGLTNHHTLIQMIPAMLLAAALIQWLPFFLRSPSRGARAFLVGAHRGQSLQPLDPRLPELAVAADTNSCSAISSVMAVGIFALTAAISFFYVAEFRLARLRGGRRACRRLLRLRELLPERGGGRHCAHIARPTRRRLALG